MNRNHILLAMIVFTIICITIGSALPQIIPPTVQISPIKALDSSLGTIQSDDPVITGIDQTTDDVTTVSSDNTTFSRGLMHFTDEQLKKREAARTLMPKVASLEGIVLPKASKSLLSSVPYTGNDRDQGYCGNCWVWASTGALEIEHAIDNSVKDRLSIQYFNSNWNGGAAVGNACNGGFPDQVADFYTSTLKKGIPWSNTNAGYADYYWNGGASGIAANLISTTPNYPIVTVTDEELITHTGQSTAINNIKSQINANKPVLWYYALPTSGWTAFNTFWANQPESTVWDPDSYAGTEVNGAHEVLIIGYDDTGSTPYWLVLNSWGITSGRPTGLFRVKMNLNYDATMTYGSYTQYAHYFDIFQTTFVIPTPTPTPTSTPTITPTPTPTSTPTSTPTVTPTPTPTSTPTSTPTVTPTPTPLPGNGTLTVSSVPTKAKIWIDEVITGRVTPATLSSISSGPHTLKLTMSGYFDYTQPFTIIQDQTTTISAKLIRGGTLSVVSKPAGASIRIDGSDTGKFTPSSFTTLAAGSHTVTLVKTGYADYSKTVTIESGRITSIYGVLPLTGGSIRVSSNPYGAAILIDGVDIGYQTPKTVSGLLVGSHTVVLKKDGYQDWSKIVFVNAQMITSTYANLIPGGSNGSLFMYSNPSGANIAIDGVNTGHVTPKTLTSIPAGQHAILITKTGYNDWMQTVSVRSGMKSNLYARLSSRSVVTETGASA